MTSVDIVKFTNCRLALGDRLVARDLYVSSTTGKIIDPSQAFYSQRPAPSITHDLGGRILAPGFIDVQLNGGFGFDFSVPREKDEDYLAGLEFVNKNLVKTGVTSYTPSMTSQKPEVYHKVLHHLAATTKRDPTLGSSSLGAHCEGPFLNPSRNGIHKLSVLQTPNSFSALAACYGEHNLTPSQTAPATVKYITFAPELDSSKTVIQELASRGIISSPGHSAATYEQITEAVNAGATMITHMFNAMNQPHHRAPGIVGMLGAENPNRPFYGIIADGIHVHPSFIKLAYNAHPDGCILVTDAMAMMGLPDGRYEWTNGEVIIKKGALLTLDGTNGTIAGSVVTLLECVNNFLKWTEAGVAAAVKNVTNNPARMLGVDKIKGGLEVGMDADLVVLREVQAEGAVQVEVDEVWKFGVQVFDKVKDAAVSDNRPRL